MSLEVDAAVVNTSAQKSAASKEWQETLSHDAERIKHAAARSELFKAGQRMYHDAHGECGLCGALASHAGAMSHRQRRLERREE